MDKISGIIPSSTRVTNVDLKDAPPSRAALPGAERAAGMVARMSEAAPGSPSWRTKEARQAALASEVSNNFFMKAKPDAESGARPDGRESGVRSDGRDLGQEQVSEARLVQPEGLFPKGTFIDRNA